MIFGDSSQAFTIFKDYLTESVYIKLIILVLFLFLIWKIICYLIQINQAQFGVQYVDQQRPPLVVESLDCPFKFTINIDAASFSGIQCILRTEEPCLMKAFWGVPFHHLISVMNRDINFLRKAVTAYDPSSNVMPCIDHHVPQLLPGHEQANLEYKPRDHTEPYFSKPESKFLIPFLLLIVLENDSSVKYNTVVSMANVIHISNVCNPLPTSLKYQLIKLSSGLIGNVEQIYQASLQEGDNSCLICCTRPASIVFVPCRHCCLCYDCYHSMKMHQDGFQERCPVCRQFPDRLFELPNIT